MTQPSQSDQQTLFHQAMATTCGGSIGCGVVRRRSYRSRRFAAWSCMVQKLAEGVQIDLGGIGKGFALDCMASVLHEWDILSARLSASTSTHLALDAPPNQRGWPVGFGPEPQRVALRREALAASGVGRRGQHIVDPRSHQPARHLRAWARAARGARADALSTAFLVMTHSEMERYCRHWHVEGIIQDAPTRNHNPG